MINTVIFDLDGVLAISKALHYEALNLALLKEAGQKFVISHEDHLKKFDGLPTNLKLKMLGEDRALPTETWPAIWKAKQQYTIGLIKSCINPSNHLIELFEKLKADGYNIAVASNSIPETTKLFILRLGLMEYIDAVFTNKDVEKAKPHSSIYLKTFLHFAANPKECLIIEDSHVGVTAALESGAHLLVVKSPEETNIKNVYSRIEEINKNNTKLKFKGKKMNILIPMAGAGSRFAQAGYTFPKPLIEVHGKPMIQVVVDSLGIEGTYTYIVRKQDYDKFNLGYMLELMTPKCNVVCVDSLTEGAACTTLLAKQYVDNNEPLLIANSDQFIEYDSSEFMYAMSAGICDGGMLTFQNTHPKWSYIKLDEDKYITEVAEKKVISDKATVGIYYWARGSDYVKYAEQMIAKNIRVNGEFYVAPVYNEAILDGLKLRSFDIKKMWGLGTPEDLNYFLEHHDK